MHTAKLEVEPIGSDYVLKDRIYAALKQAIASVNVYQQPGDLRLDKRQLAVDLGVSRTPIREAIARLEQEGFVRTVPRKGVFVVRKSREEIVEMIMVWAALEGMAARLATERASDEEIATLRGMFATFEGDQVQAKIDEYSDTNIRFHQALFRLSKCELLDRMTENLFIHMRWIRMRTIGDDNRASRSIVDHVHIIEALEKRDAELAEKLAEQHTLDLASHVQRHANYLD
jgi:DNA-binding GntR family transcriptional regulator